MFRMWILAALVMVGQMAQAAPVSGQFASIDGGVIDLATMRGQPVLVVNTASRCGFTKQYSGLQTLYDRYRDRGLVVLAVPSNDFKQELGSAEEVKQFCELNYDLTLPMTDITPVKGANAHPFFQAVRAETGFEPGWNFNKILIAPDGSVAGTWGSVARPLSGQITSAIERLLP
ncbi:glutathione peroxidase [Phycobacter azelaicus]|jgi:glutathione peroxidase|uniref:glutathione peroxidase n=1 Tax=Phycobacter azelaicus TaxID=2668075 RepID=UPI001869579C|nr:glutathione peroxidase [Paracoccaceae bacterium]